MELRQKDVALLLETNIASVRNWENNRCEPNLQVLPKIINFIGFYPYNANLPISQKLRLWREINGIPQKDMALLIGIDQSTLAGWEQGKRIPSFKQKKRIQAAMIIIGELCQKRATESLPDKFLLKQEISRKMRQRLHDDLKISLSEAELRLIQQRVKSSGYVLYESGWTINEKLMAWRTSFGLSQRQMAALTGFAYQTICRWEKSYRKPHYKNITRVKRILAQLAKILSE